MVTQKKPSESDAEARARLERDGSEALRNLKKLRSRQIGAVDRRRIAENFDALLREKKLLTSDMNWIRFFGGDEAYFRNQLSRCRQVEGASEKQKLNGNGLVWANMIAMTHDALRRKGKRVSKAAIAFEVTRGTPLNPARSGMTREEKLVSAYEGLATNLAAKHDLLEHYREVSALRAAYFSATGHWLDSDQTFPYSQHWLDATLGDIYRHHRGDLLDKVLGELTVEEWAEFKASIPDFAIRRADDVLRAHWVGENLSNEDGDPPEEQELLATSMSSLFDLREDHTLAKARDVRLRYLDDQQWEALDERLWLVGDGSGYQWEKAVKLSDPQTAFSSFAFEHSGFRLKSIRQLPHAVVGMMNYNFPVCPGRFDLWRALHEREFCETGFDGSINYDAMHEGDWPWCGNGDGHPLDGLVYLVLLPVLQLDRLVPYLAVMYDGNGRWPLERELGRPPQPPQEEPNDLTDYRTTLLAPFRAGEPTFMKDVFDLLEEDAERIFSDLAHTAAEVRDYDPYLKRDREREERVDRLFKSQWIEQNDDSVD